LFKEGQGIDLGSQTGEIGKKIQKEDFLLGKAFYSSDVPKPTKIKNSKESKKQFSSVLKSDGKSIQKIVAKKAPEGCLVLNEVFINLK
jgi:hypothetical protein